MALEWAARPMISGSTRWFGIIGDPIQQVRAPTLFNALFAERGYE